LNEFYQKVTRKGGGMSFIVMAKNFPLRDEPGLFPPKTKLQFMMKIFENQRVDCLISFGIENA
jgi:hypothetical protein